MGNDFKKLNEEFKFCLELANSYGIGVALNSDKQSDYGDMINYALSTGKLFCSDKERTEARINVYRCQRALMWLQIKLDVDDMKDRGVM